MTRITPTTSRSAKLAAASAILAAIACTAASAAAAPSTTEPADPAPQPPVEFTACNEGFDERGVTGGEQEQLTIPVSGGEITVNRDSALIVPQIMTEISDPRLDGTWDWAWNEDDYTGPQVANIVTIILRIENDEGAWQGADTVVRFGDEEWDVQFVLAGEGANEGLTAAMAWYDSPTCPNIRGYILELGVPEAAGTFPDR